jgi:hypothetical protein
VLTTQGGAASATNAGTWTKVGAGDFQNTIPFTNTGTLRLQEGTWLWSTPWSNAGTLEPAAGRVFSLNHATLQAGTVIGGQGGFDVGAGTGTTLAVAVTFGRPLSVAGTVNGTGALTIANQLTWTRGLIEGGSGVPLTVAPGATLALSSGENKSLWRALVNEGTVTATEGALFVSNGGSVTNAASGMWTVTGPWVLTTQGGGASVTNAGTWTKVGAGDFQDTIPFTNTGTLRLQEGTWVWSTPWSNAGTLEPATGRVFSLNHATLQAGTVIGGQGTFDVGAGASTTLATAVTFGRPLSVAGTVNGTGALTIANQLTWTRGLIEGGSGVPLTVAPGATLALATGENKSLWRALVNEGTVTATEGALYVSNGGSIANTAGGTWTVTGPWVLTTQGGAASATNAGTWTKVGAGDFQDTIPFTNTGTLRLQEGTWLWSTPWSNAGTLEPATGRVFSLNHATLQAGTVIGGQGTFDVGAGTSTTLATAVTFGRPLSVAGTVTGAGALTIANQLTWTRGLIDGGGDPQAVLTVAPGATLALSSGDNKSLWRALVNQGTVTATEGALYVSNGGSITNAAGGTWTVTGPWVLTTQGGGASATNAGTWTKVGAGDFQDTIPFTNTGTLRLQDGTWTWNTPWSNAGTLEPAAGRVFSVNYATLQAGTVIGGQGGFDVGAGTGTTLATAVTFGRPLSVAGTITGTGALTIANQLTWTRGLIDGGGDPQAVLTVAPGATLALSSGDNKSLWRALVNEGTVTATEGALFVSNGGSVTNAANGTWTVTGPWVLTTQGGGASATNFGLFSRAGATGDVSVFIPFTNTGTLRVRLGGTAAGEFDRFNVSSATLGGTLDVSTINGFTPASGNTFDVITGTYTGTFATLNGNGQTYVLSYPAGVVRVTRP